ncbi:hypothetical protein BEP19_08035 [Ammoniphilus oxalaticus]|uniref:DUF3846 domain-containing protein n=1 Tax=Ammoniphilus oxalaticus TaxID=66863 RepID=A0A419SK73_9BACL|nr:hypothetical protein [Ammoniphilus oxalaticus]RKD24336.1 hypothetical protein BEP19_08035 [Ammoniphilus oxalaticus]
MIKIMLKLPGQEQADPREVKSVQDLEKLMEGEFELTEDDQLPGIYILVNEEARGVKAHNFTIQSEGAHDWVYGPSVMLAMQDDQATSLTEQQIEQIHAYFASARMYK